MPPARKGSGVRQGLSTHASPGQYRPALCAVVWLFVLLFCCSCWPGADAQVLRRQTSGKWSCVHKHTKKVLLSGSYPNLDYAPIVSPQNKDVCGDRYTPNVECTFSVYGPANTYIYVEFLNLDLDRDCEQDSVSVVTKKKQRRFCGSQSSKQLSVFVIDDNSASVNFKSNMEYACRGFSGFLVVFTPEGALKDNDRRRRAPVTQPQLQQEAYRVIGDGKLRQMREQTKVVYDKGTCDICEMTQVADCHCRAPFFERMHGRKGKQEEPTLSVNSGKRTMYRYSFNGRVVHLSSPRKQSSPIRRTGGTTRPNRRTTPPPRSSSARRTTRPIRRTTPSRSSPSRRSTRPTRSYRRTSQRTKPSRSRPARQSKGTARSPRRNTLTRKTTSKRSVRRASANKRPANRPRRTLRSRKRGKRSAEEDNDGYSPDLVYIDLERPTPSGDGSATVESPGDHLAAEQSSRRPPAGTGSLQMQQQQAPSATSGMLGGQPASSAAHMPSDKYSIHLQSRFKRAPGGKKEGKKECVCRR